MESKEVEGRKEGSGKKEGRKLKERSWRNE
jgi:hypothetical protein